MQARSRRGVSRNIIIIAVVLIVILVIAGVYTYQTYLAPRPKDTLIIGTTDSVETGLDPALAYDYFGWEIIQSLGSGLVDLKPGTPNGGLGTDIIPALAVSWSSSTSGLNWTFNLRQGVHYDDGSEFNATSVKYSYERGMRIAADDGAFVGIGYSDIIDDINVVSRYQVRFDLKIPFSPFLSLMATQSSFIVDPKYGPPSTIINYTAGDARASNPMGLGPYRLADWTRTAGRDQEMRLEANPNYWNASGGYPKTKNLIIQFYADATALRLAIEQGQIDIAFRQLRASDINDLKTKTSVKVWEGQGQLIQYLVFQNNIKPFDDPRVRRAIAAALNRTSLVNTVFVGQAAPLYSLIPSGMAGHTDAYKTLGDANYTFTINTLNDPTIFGGPYNSTHKLVIDFWHENQGHYPQSNDQALVIRQSLEASGVIQVNDNSLDWASYRNKRRDQNMPMFEYGWYPDYIDPDDYVFPFLHVSGSSWLHYNYNNTQMNELIEWARGNTSTSVRNSLYAQIQNLMVQEAPIVSLYHSGAAAVTKPNIKGVYLDVSTNWRNWLLYAE